MEKPHWNHVDGQLMTLHRFFSEHAITSEDELEDAVARFIREHVEYVSATYVSNAVNRSILFDVPRMGDYWVALSGFPGMSGHLFLYKTHLLYDLRESQIVGVEYEDLYAEGRTGSYLTLRPSTTRFIACLFEYLFDPFPKHLGSEYKTRYL